jgi:formylglycine-generating enzyme required for sulfatase activity
MTSNDMGEFMHRHHFFIVGLFAMTLGFASIPEAQAMESGDLLLIKGGTFIMGSPGSEALRQKEERLHRVTISDFYMGKHEVTQKEYREIMNIRPGNFQGDALPVENVTWFEAIQYCNERSKKEGLTPAYGMTGSGETLSVSWNRDANGYRLPTEAEWEYACRAGTATPFNTGNNIGTGQANYYGTYPYKDAPRGEYRERTLPVGSFAPNAWGLHDMHGNVWEWCWDRYGEYSVGEQKDPDGPPEGSYRVNRGGGWNDFGRHLRSAYRAAHPPINRTFNLGFRVVRNAR